MAWDDPSPRARNRTAAAAPSSQPGYGDEPGSFGRLMFRMLLAGVIGVSTALGAKAILAAWHGNAAHASPLDLVLVAAVGFVAAVLAWRYVTNRAASRFLVFGYGRRRSWDDRYDQPTVSGFVVAEVVGDVVGAAIDAAID